MEMDLVKHMKEIYDALQNEENKRIVIVGKPGVGKTWMAKKIADRAIRSRIFDVALWVFMYRDYKGHSLCKSFARQLSLISGIEEWEAGDENKVNEEYEEDAGMDVLKPAVQNALSGEKIKRILLILDGVDDESEEEIKPLLAEYVNVDKPTVKILVTRRDNDSLDGKMITVPAPKVEDLFLSKLSEKYGPPLNERVKNIAKTFIKKSDTPLVTEGSTATKSEPSPATITLIEKVMTYFGQNEQGLALLEKELDEASESDTYNVKQLLFSNQHTLLQTSNDSSKNFTWREPHFFHDRGCVRYNELVARWILEGYLGRVESLKRTYQLGHHVLMELMDCGVIKKQEAGYVFVDGSEFHLDDFHFHHSYPPTASLGLGSVFSEPSSEDDEWEGLGRITQKDGMIKSLSKGRKVQIQSSNEKGENQNQSSEKKNQKLSTLFLDENQYSGKELIEFLQKESELQFLALFNPTITSLDPLEKMTKLSILVLRGCDFLVQINLPLRCLPNLSVLEISGASSLKEIPSDFFKDMTQLKSLNISEAQIDTLPYTFYSLTSLRWLVIKDCPLLKKLESLTKLGGLASLDLSGNTSLTFVDKNFLKFESLKSINLSNTMVWTTPLLKNLGGLTHLVLKDCKNLGRLRGITSLTSLRTLDISGCEMFEEFHDSSLESLSSLQTLDLSDTKIDHLPSGISNPRHVILKRCSLLEELSCMEKLTNLEVLDLSGSSSLATIEEGFFDNMTSLRVLNLSETKVKTLPSFSNLCNLHELCVSRCFCLETLPEMDKLDKLEILDASHCNCLVEIGTGSFNHMSRLQKLNLSGTKIESLPAFSDPSNLCQLLLVKCSNLKDLSFEISLLKLEVLNLSGVSSLGESGIGFLEKMHSLKVLNLSFTLVEELPSMSNLKSLTHLSLAGCPGVTTIPNFESLTNLEVVDLSGTSVNHLPRLDSFRNLRRLLLGDCSSMEEFPNAEVNDLRRPTSYGISKLTSLEYLHFPNVEVIPEGNTSKQDWSICRLSCTDKPPLFVPSCQFLTFFEKNSSLRDKFDLCMGPSSEDYLHRHELIFGDIYFQTSQFAGFKEKRSLQIRGLDHSLKGMANIQNVLGHVECLLLIDCKFRSLLSAIDISHFKKLKGCWIERCEEMGTVFHEDEAKENAEMGRMIEHLGISHASLLESIYNGKQTCGSFNKLNSLYLDSCPMLSSIFRSSWLPENLKVLQIKHCDKLENLFDHKFPHLHTLVMFELPELKSVGCKMPSLRTLKVWECPKLNNLEEVVKLAKDLETLWISGDTRLKSIDGGNLESNNFINLKALKIENCPVIENVTSSSVPLQNLEILQVRSCENLKILFPQSDSRVCPRLRTLHLHDLPVLESILDPLPDEHLIEECPSLKSLHHS